ncbi:MAG: hypothetical protein V4581_07205, partial [Bacteroidota bacterium]
MKKLLTLLLVFTSLICFAQETKTITNGYITFNSGTTLHFKSLTITGETVKYMGDTAAAETEVALSGIKKIIDNAGAVIYGKEKTNVLQSQASETVFAPKPEAEKLMYKSYTKIYEGDKKLKADELESRLKVDTAIYERYKSGANQAVWGDILIGGGIGFAIGTGIGNVINSNNDKKGSSVGIIVGLAVTAVGIPVKLGGTKKVKQAVNDYNALPVKQVSFFDRSELKVIAGANGVGFALR